MEMQFYGDVPSPLPGAATTRQELLDAFSSAGLGPAAELDGKFWVVTFTDLRMFVNFQEEGGKLCFAALDTPPNEINAGNTAFDVLEDLGWEAHEEFG